MEYFINDQKPVSGMATFFQFDIRENFPSEFTPELGFVLLPLYYNGALMTTLKRILFTEITSASET